MFAIDLDGMDGGVLNPVCRNPDDLSILANMGMVEGIREGLYGKERFEFELAARLGGVAQSMERNSLF